MSDISPGPWQAAPGFQVLDADSQQVCKVSIDLVDGGRWGTLLPGARCLANRAAILAVPELVAALEAALGPLDWAACGGGHSRRGGRNQMARNHALAVLGQVRAALSKAREVTA